MQHRKTVSLTSKDDEFITAQISAGEFGNASEVVRAGLRLLELEQIKLQTLRKAIADGDAAYDRGEYATYEPGQLAARLKGKLGTRK